MALTKILKNSNGYYVKFEYKKKMKDKPNTYFRKYQTFYFEEGMTIAKMEKQAAYFHTIFMEECEKEYNKINIEINESMYFKDFFKIYKEKVKKSKSATFYGSVIYCEPIILEQLGEYKLKELTPVIIQKFYDFIAELQIEEKICTPVKNFKRLESSVSYKANRFSEEVNTAHYKWIKKARNNEDVSYKWADDFSKYLNVPINKLFKVRIIKRDAAYQTKKKYITILKVCLHEAQRKLLIEQNYATSDFTTFINDPSPNKEKNVLVKEEFEKLYLHILNSPNSLQKLFFVLMLNTGARREEIFGLKWKNVDKESRTISFENTVVQAPGLGKIINEYKTKNQSSNRKIAISEEVLNVLKDYKKMINCTDENSFIFLDKKGEITHPSTANRWLNKYLDECNLKHVTVHELRHSYASIMINYLPIAEVSKTLGHAQLSTTLNMYSHKVTNYQGQKNLTDIINNKEKTDTYKEILEKLDKNIELTPNEIKILKDKVLY